MLDVDTYRRPYHSGCEPQALDHRDMNPLLYSGMIGKQDSSLLPWHQGQSPISGVASEPRSDADDEDDEEYRPFTPPPPRERLSYTRYQLEMLNGIYARVKYPNSTQKLLIGKRVGITREQVKIWFQNRRRKDVVGKKKDESESDGSKSDISDTKSDNGDSDSGVSEDNDKVLVPDVVMKSVIAELKKFEKEPLKTTKSKKRMKASKKKISKARAQQLPSLVLVGGGYDMVSPPNQVTPTAAFTRPSANKFNHSKDMSAFETPRDVTRYTDSYGPISSNSVMPNSQRYFPMKGMSGILGGSGMQPNNVACDMPVLSDLLNYTTNSSRHNSQSDSTTYSQHPGALGYIGHHPALGRVYPFPFVAEPPMLLNALRQVEQYRSQISYPRSQHISTSHSHFQPFPVSSLTNPHYPSTSIPWSNNQPTTESSYATL